METSLQEKPKRNFSSYFVVVAFLALEVTAFLSFSLGFSFLLYGILGLVLVALLILVTYREINFDGITRMGYFVFPLLMFGLLTAVSIFTKYQIQGTETISIADTVFIPISMAVFVFIGYFLSLNKIFKLKTMMLVAYSALAVYVLINFFATMVQFGPFYSFLYPHSKFYYGGEVSPEISNFAYALIGFQITEVASFFYCLFPTLLLTSCVNLFFIKPKDNKKIFVVYCGFTLLALISIIFVANPVLLIFELLFAIVLGWIITYIKLYKSEKARKVSRIVLYSGIALVVLGLLVVFLNAQEDWSFTSGLRNAISSNALLNRLFNTNRFVKPVNCYFVNLLTKQKIFGFYQYNPSGIHPNSSVISSSGIFLIDNLASAGLFGALAFLIFIIIGVKRVFKLMTKDEFLIQEKAMVIAFVSMFFVYLCLCNVYDITIFANVRTNYYLQGLFLIVLLLIGYCFNVTKKEVTENVQTTQN